MPFPRQIIILAALLLGGCASSFGPPPSEAPEDLGRRQMVLETALGQIGRPYRYGGGDSEGFDCSGLARRVYAEVGISLPRTAAEQAEEGQEISLDHAAPGDLVFFHIKGGEHVTIYIGDNRVVHAPSRGKDVRVVSLDVPYWQDHFWKVVRILD